MERKIHQPWASLICSGLLKEVPLSVIPDAKPGRFVVYSLFHADPQTFTMEVMQEMYNSSVFGSSLFELAPIYEYLGIIEISEVNEETKMVTISQSRELSDFIQYDSFKINHPRVEGFTLYFSLRKREFEALNTPKEIYLCLTESVRNVIFTEDGNLRELREVGLSCGNKIKWFDYKGIRIESEKDPQGNPYLYPTMHQNVQKEWQFVVIKIGYCIR